MFPETTQPGREAVCYRGSMNWILPAPTLLFAGVALLPLATLVRRPTSAPRLLAELFVTTLAVIALIWLA